MFLFFNIGWMLEIKKYSLDAQKGQRTTTKL